MEYPPLTTHRVHLPQYGAFPKEEGFSCIHQDQVEVGLPWPMGTPRLQRQKQTSESGTTQKTQGSLTGVSPSIAITL